MAHELNSPSTDGTVASRRTKRRILFASVAGLVLVTGVILSLPLTNSRENLFNHFRRGFDEKRRAFEQRRRAWEDQRRAEEQARRAAAASPSQSQSQPAPTSQPTNP